jgi:hypothetical protein
MTRDAHAHLYREDTGLGAINARIRDSVENFRATLTPDERATIAPVAPYPLGLPVLTPETWRQYQTGMRDCAVGRFYEELRATSAWREQAPQGARGGDDPPMFANVDHALGWYVEAREDGYSAGSVYQAVERLGAMGCHVQQGGESRDPVAIIVADKLATMERMLALAYEPGAHGIGAAACLRILLLRRVGELVVGEGYGGRKHRKAEPVDADLLAARHGITAREVHAIVRSGRERMTIEMVARGLVRMPRASARVLEAIERRIGELGYGRHDNGNGGGHGRQR